MRVYKAELFGACLVGLMYARTHTHTVSHTHTQSLSHTHTHTHTHVEYEEIARVSICPFNILTGYTLFVEDEDKSANALLTRSDLESHMVREVCVKS